MRERGSKYRYVMLIASTLMAMITVGGLNSFSILYKELLDFYDTRAGDTAIISSLCIFLNFAIGPFANYASEIYSFRVVMFVGGFFGFLGLFLSAFVLRMELWILTYGVFSGWIRDVTGDWTVSFRVSRGVALLAGLLFFVEPAFRTKCQRKRNTSR
ncbi:monocarboxylate transporter 4 isoform X5 [Magallana gigas]|uniref:monocarboxylate transporter 4 isoform X5 n=1 Tax=Magallana gigas TaxID=29159 RepID=UPI00333F6752